MSYPRRRAGLAAAVVVAALIIAPAAPAQAASAYLPPNDFCIGQCADILPPGQNGNATLADILAHQSLGTRPAHSSDQLARYASLLSAYTGLSTDQIARFYYDASFGVPASQVESRISPRSDVTIVRDRATGVPHITGTTRAGTMFGAGYAGAQDRLFLMDLLRHVGRGNLTSFAGGSPGNQALEQSVWRNSPYTEADFQAQVTALRNSGPRGALLYNDITAYVAGVNAYINACMTARPVYCPGEYVLTGHLDPITNAGGPKPFVITDLIAISGVVGGLFGGGGGAEMRSALALLESRARYGNDAAWRAFRSQNDPETVLTLHNGQSFPYGQAPANPVGVVLPDRGTAAPVPVVFNPSTAAASERPPVRKTMSNAVVASGSMTTTGNPIAVFGPQTGYFAPQLLMLQELQGPGISARGAAFAGLNLYVLLGRGQDYAWSATSAGQDITDTFAVQLCGEWSYIDNGQCVPMEVLRQDNSWKPTLADPTPAGSYSLITYRTRHGLVTWKGMVNGVPTAFTAQRSTYQHEADSAIGFQMFNDPAVMGSANGFMTAASAIGYAFNWFYLNAAESAYFNSGSNPVRAAGADPNLPQRAGQTWTGFTPAAAHPQSVNQDYYISWNNKQARDYSAADGNFSFGAVHRGQMLDAPMKQAAANGRKLDRADVVRIMADAATIDLRAQQNLGLLLRVIDSQPVTDPAQAAAVSALRAWAGNGSHRLETMPGSRTYRDSAAIKNFDAWWGLLVSGMFRPGLGDGLYSALTNAIQVDEPPLDRSQPHKGSAFQYGWWGYVNKDLRSLLGDPVSGPLPQTYCGGGSLSACRSVLLSTLTQAAAVPANQVYPGDSTCAAGDQWCADSIVQSALGGITHPNISWQNRPTYQQVVQFPARRGDAVSNLAHGKTATASSTQFLTGHVPSRAVDASSTTRWSSSYSDSQWIKVDLGAPQAIRRVMLHWEAAFGRAYRLEVSTDNTNWTTVFATSTGDGGTDNVTFAPTTARYVRMQGVARGTQYGYSLWEFEIYNK